MLTSLGITAALAGNARADAATPTDDSRKLSDITGSYQLQLAMASAGLTGKVVAATKDMHLGHQAELCKTTGGAGGTFFGVVRFL